MFLLSYVGLNLREELIYIAAVLFIGTFILMFIRKNATLKQIVVFSVICFVMISGSLVADKVYVKTHNWQEGWNFINARSSFLPISIFLPLSIRTWWRSWCKSLLQLF